MSEIELLKNMSEIELLERIAKNTDHKTSFQVIVSGNQSSFNTLFNPKIELDRNKVYEIALVNLETYYSFPNIDNTNNTFVYSHDQGVTWTKIKIPTGSYEIDDLNNTIRFEMEKAGHYDEVNNDPYISISANSNTDVSPGFKIIESPVNLVYLPLLTDTIQNLNLSITD